MYYGHREPLEVSESCRTRIPGWPNPRVHWIDSVAVKFTWKHPGVTATSLGVLNMSLGVPTTTLGAHRITVEPSRKNIIVFGNSASADGYHSSYLLLNNV